MWGTARAPVPVDEALRDWSPLPEDELQFYDDQGYLLIKSMFSEAEAARGIRVVDEALARGASTTAWHPSFTDRTHTLRIRDAISQCPDLGYFLDHPRLVGPLASLLGTSVQILGTEIFVRSCQNQPLEGWHTDGGEHLQRIVLSPGSQSLQLKCQVFLTDVSTPDSGNLLLIPGSHRRLPERTRTCYLDGLNERLDRGELPADAVIICARPGDALLFPYGLWHAVAPNRRAPRKTFIVRYGQLWHRPYDYLNHPPEILAEMSPRLRRMFGDLGPDAHPLDYYKPQDQAVVMAGAVPRHNAP